MRLPPQAPPVPRPDLVQPHRTVDVVHGTAQQLISIRIQLMHGANFSDPQYWAWPSYSRAQQSSHGGCGA
ncbi:cyanobactin biosynthesis system PatB/AcyB/McaB family protein [Nocardia sp. NPDC050408]|uniref:cyanobactin biosynthesis system PatB/AcyB/McaB family protein n=1 Tax=unclassified Nocardia TaxID=2637762 RepID=UPI003443E8D4